MIEGVQLERMMKLGFGVVWMVEVVDQRMDCIGIRS